MDKADVINPDNVIDFVNSSKPKGLEVGIKTFKKYISKVTYGLQFVNTIKNDLPTKDDSQLSSAIKLVSLVSNILSKIPDTVEENVMKRISKAFNLQEEYNSALMDIVNDFNLLSEFQRIQLPKDAEESKSFSDNYGKVVLYKNPKIGIIGVRETLSDASSYMLHSKDFSPSMIWDLVWKKSNGCVDVQKSVTQYKTFMFNPYPLDIGNHFGSANDRMNEFIEKNRKFISLGFDRSYMFLGPPGSGKSSMSQYFARKFSNRILQFSPEVIWGVNDISIMKLIEESGADIILVDELDKMMNLLTTSQQGLLLSRIEKIRKCKKELITIITANSVKNFSNAMLRPGRIDDIIEFNYPDNEDRKKILQGYANVLDVKIDNDVINRISDISEGLTGAWLKEVVMQMKVSDPDSACNLIEKMLKYSNPNLNQPQKQNNAFEPWNLLEAKQYSGTY